MISSFIHEKLIDWQKWLNTDEGLAICTGYPSKDMIQRVREGGIRAIGIKPPTRNYDAERMDLLICKLCKIQKISIISRYYWKMSDRKAAEKLKISHQAHNGNIHAGAKNLEKMWHEGICLQINLK